MPSYRRSKVGLTPIYFGHRDDYALILSRANLERVVTLAGEVITALNACGQTPA